jgi:tRNA (guanine-N7-)-methyltransferase
MPTRRTSSPASQLPVGAIEKEFGVPMPGRILPPEQWARTALKRIPRGLLNWQALFGRDAPVVIDIGCGNGRSTLTSAVARPEVDHFAIDTLPVVIRYATRRGNQRGLHNVRFAVIGGKELLAEHVAAGSVAEIHLFHPQPYYDAEQSGRRLITPEFLRLAHLALRPGGKLLLQTDHGAYWNYMKSIVPCFFQWHERDSPWPDAPLGRSRREIIARLHRLPIYRGEAIRRDDITAADALQLASQLPPPTFHADPRLREIDRLEASTT